MSVKTVIDLFSVKGVTLTVRVMLIVMKESVNNVKSANKSRTNSSLDFSFLFNVYNFFKLIFL